MTTKLEISKVTLKDKHQTMLDDVSLSLEDKQIVGLLGRNGAGKTSLLSLVASYRLPDAGEILIDGEPAFENAAKTAQVVFIYPTDQSEETETVEDNMSWISSYQENFDRDYAIDLLDQFQIPLDQPINKLSKGMQSAVQVSFGLASRAPITIFDEAYLSMDAPSRELFYEALLKDQANHPRLFILSTHLVSEAEYLFDALAILHKGQLISHESYDDLLAKAGTVTGSIEAVEAFTKGKEIINEKQLGKVKSVTVFTQDFFELQAEANRQDLEVTEVSLQSLFIYLTEGIEDE